MPIDTRIIDGEGTNLAGKVTQNAHLPAGAVVYTTPLDEGVGSTKAFINDVYGADFNIDASFGGTPDGVHDGTDSVLWTASALSGTWTFDSTAQAFAGTKSIDGTATVNNDEAQFERASSISSGSYVAFTAAIYITSWSGSGTKEVEIRTRIAGVDVSTVLNLSNYIDTTLLNSWQSFSIPIADFDMGGASFDQVVLRVVDVGGGQAPNFYLDAMQWEETSGAIVFSVPIDRGTSYSISDLTITLAGPLDTTLASASHPKLAYDQILGLSTLTNGIRFTLITKEVVRFNSSFRKHIDFMSFPGLTVQSGGDGTNAWVSYTAKFSPPAVLDSTTLDSFTLTVSDDLSSLLHARVLVRGAVREL